MPTIQKVSGLLRRNGLSKYDVRVRSLLDSVEISMVGSDVRGQKIHFLKVHSLIQRAGYAMWFYYNSDFMALPCIVLDMNDGTPKYGKKITLEEITARADEHIQKQQAYLDEKKQKAAAEREERERRDIALMVQCSAVNPHLMEDLSLFDGDNLVGVLHGTANAISGKKVIMVVAYRTESNFITEKTQVDGEVNFTYRDRYNRFSSYSTNVRECDSVEELVLYALARFDE